jgi:hypothetical protein
LITLLFVFGLATLLVGGGVRGSLHLRPHRLSTGQLLSGLRRSSAAPLKYTQHDDKTSHYYRKAWITLILLLVLLSVLMITLLNAVIH